MNRCEGCGLGDPDRAITKARKYENTKRSRNKAVDRVLPLLGVWFFSCFRTFVLS